MRRCYKYAIEPTPRQAQRLDRIMHSARRFWNLLIEKQRFAENQLRHGRRGALYEEYRDCLLGKQRYFDSEVKAYATDHALSLEDALTAVRRLRAKSDFLAGIRDKKSGRLIRWMDRRDRAVKYALQVAEREWKREKAEKHPLCPHQSIKNALLVKFEDSNKLYIRGKRKALHFKKRTDNITVQAQITGVERAENFIAGETVDLRKIGLSEVLARVPILYHRPMPGNGTVKQLAIVNRGQRYYVVFFVEEPKSNARTFTPAPNTVIGIDPGIKIALAISSLDGSIQKEIAPPIAKDKRFLANLRRKARRADRMLRKANPDCFNPDGTWKKRLPHRLAESKNLLALRKSVRGDYEHVANARRDFYHNAANELLNSADIIGVGHWRGAGKAGGEGKRKKGANRKLYNHAISDFVSILKYKSE